MEVLQGFFTKFFMGGLAFGDDFWSLSGTESDGGLASGTESDEGLDKLSADAKNSPYSKIRANFHVLSIK